jgi:hypothetical protein
MNSEPFPVDFDALRKGDVIDAIRIERIYNVRRATQPDRFRLSTLKLREDIERRRPDLLCRSVGDDVQIMTDQEAEAHTWDRIGSAVRQMGRSTTRRAVIDRSGFSDSQKAVAESRDRAATMLALANRKELAKAERESRMLGEAKKTECR